MVTLLPWLSAPLAGLLAGQRGHAVLLAGPEGLGQFELAHALAQAWLCEHPDPARRPCGTCPSCMLVHARTHPDLLMLLPEALLVERGWESEGEGKAGKAKPSKEIKVESLRAAVEFAQQTSSRGVAKVVLIHPAERMNTISANTLLKTLEEPPGQARFVLSTGAIDALMPTIRSRCQHASLHLPPEAQSVAWLAQQGVADPQAMLAAAGQQPLTALRMVQQGIDAAAWKRLPSQMAQGQGAAMKDWPVPLVIQTLQKLCHDVLCRSLGATPRFFVAEALPASGDVERLTAWAAELRRLARHDEHPWNAGLMLESLVGQARRALHSAR